MLVEEGPGHRAVLWVGPAWSWGGPRLLTSGSLVWGGDSRPWIGFGLGKCFWETKAPAGGLRLPAVGCRSRPGLQAQGSKAGLSLEPSGRSEGLGHGRLGLVWPSRLQGQACHVSLLEGSPQLSWPGPPWEPHPSSAGLAGDMRGSLV